MDVSWEVWREVRWALQRPNKSVAPLAGQMGMSKAGQSRNVLAVQWEHCWDLWKGLLWGGLWGKRSDLWWEIH